MQVDKMSENVLGRYDKARSDLDQTHGNLLHTAKLIGNLKKAARTPQHSRQINALSNRTTRATNNLVRLIGEIPLSTIQEENQSYKGSPPRIIEEYGMVSPRQLEDKQIDPHFQRIFPDVSQRDLEEEFAAYPTSENTPPTSVDEIEHKSSSPPQQKAKSKRRRRRRKTKTPPRSPSLSPDSQRILAELERDYQEDQKALQRAQELAKAVEAEQAKGLKREQAEAEKQAENLAAEQANILAAFDPYGSDFGLTEEELREVNEEARRLGILDGGKRKKRKTRKRKRRRKTRKRKKKRRKRKTRRR